MMAWLRALTLLDWDVVVFWCMVASSLLFLLVLLVTIFFQEEQKSKARECDNQRTTLQQLLGQKLLPIEPSLGWQLAGVFNNLRVWARQLPLPNGSIHILHGCCAIVEAEAEDILAAVQNITKQREWDPTVASITQSDLPRLLDSLAGENPIMMDTLRITPSVRHPAEPVRNSSSSSLRLGHVLACCLKRLPRVTRLGMLIPDEPTMIRDVVMNRIWQVEKDGSCWMFSKTEESTAAMQSTWCYILIQPILETTGRSVIHLILSPPLESCDTPKGVGKRLAVRLAALRQYIKHTRLKLHPFSHTTLQHISDLLPVMAVGKESDEPMQDPAEEKPRRSRASERRAGGAEAPEATKSTRTNSSTAAPKAKPVQKSLSPAGKLKKTMPSRSKRNRVRALGASGGSAAGVAEADSNSSSSEDTGYSDWMSNKGSLERDSKAPGVSTSDPGVVSSMIDYMMCDEEPTSVNDGSDELYTLASQCTSELLGQANRVAAINVNCSVAQQKAQTGGWFFHSLAKEVVILQKNPVQGKYHCFLGKGLIRAPPGEVYKAVKNPRTRFIYDNMLKKMDIIKELDDNVKIVHAVHEVPQLLKKESRDFCILQASKIVGPSHIVSFTSVNVAECRPMEAVARGHVIPSGWIIEPVADNTGQYSMVTYIVQVNVGTKGVPASFIHFLSTRVPLSVAYLRMFVEAENM